MRALWEWPSHLETVHSTDLIDMELERVGEMKRRMDLQPQCSVVVVAGTNGKGLVYAYLSRTYTQVGFKVDTLASPRLLCCNERIATSTRPVEDAAIVTSFERIEATRISTSLTYFEFNILAVVDIFIRERVNVMMLEVGLDGRLDIVSVSDADHAVVTSVDLDHQAFLGDTIEQVVFEKAGVFRSGRPTICGQTPPSESLRRHAGEINAELLLIKRDFDFSTLENVQWSCRYHPQDSDGRTRSRNALPFPALRGAYRLSNAACALTVLEYLGDRLPVDIVATKRGLLLVENPGRFQVLLDWLLTTLDVGHNPHAICVLRRSLINLMFIEERTTMSSISADKDTDDVLDTVKDQLDEWHIVPLDVPRGMTAEVLVRKLPEHGIENAKVLESIERAYRAALEKADKNDRVVVFDSFYTVAIVVAALSWES